MQIIHHVNKYAFQNFKTLDYCNLIKCLDVLISTASDLKAMADDSETLVLGQVGFDYSGRLSFLIFSHKH